MVLNRGDPPTVLPPFFRPVIMQRPWVSAVRPVVIRPGTPSGAHTEEGSRNAAAPLSIVRTALRHRSMRRGHLLGKVTPSLVRHACVDNVAVDHRLVEQLVCDLAERERPRHAHPRSVELTVDVVQGAVTGEGDV